MIKRKKWNENVKNRFEIFLFRQVILCFVCVKICIKFSSISLLLLLGNCILIIILEKENKYLFCVILSRSSGGFMHTHTLLWPENCGAKLHQYKKFSSSFVFFFFIHFVLLNFFFSDFCCLKICQTIRLATTQKKQVKKMKHSAQLALIWWQYRAASSTRICYCCCCCLSETSQSHFYPYRNTNCAQIAESKNTRCDENVKCNFSYTILFWCIYCVFPFLCGNCFGFFSLTKFSIGNSLFKKFLKAHIGACTFDAWRKKSNKKKSLRCSVRLSIWANLFVKFH